MTPQFDPFAETPEVTTRRPAEPATTWSTPEEGLIERLIRVVRARKWLILQATIIVPVIALVYSLQQPATYQATASLLFRDATAGVVAGKTSNVVIDPTRTAATNSSLITLPVVSDYAAKEIKGVSPGEIYGSVTVDTGAGSSDLVQIVATSSSPERAAQIANAYGAGYIAFRKVADREALATSIADIQRQLDGLSAEQSAGADGTALRTQLTDLQSAEALRTGGAELVQKATPPTAQSSPNTKRNVILGVVLGFMLGLGLALLVDRLNRRVNDPADLERLYGVPVLAHVPRRKRLADSDFDLESEDIEAFRILRTNLRYLSLTRPLTSLLVASPVPGDGKSTIARLLAATMAQMGDEVLLVDLDLHKQRHDDSPGLSSVLIGMPVDEALRSEVVGRAADGSPRRLTVLPAGPVPPNPLELIDSPQMHDLVGELEQLFDLVILDAPALNRVSDGLAIVPTASGVLIVGGMGKTTTDAAEELRAQIERLGGRPVGVVANLVSMPRHSYGYGTGR